jgi:aspartyl-tRNA(Asn)/glutamyl-tRNA(Gln) amidotransferase subunit A
MKDLYFMSACALTDAIKRQELTAVEVAEKIIERIEKINPKINAYCTPTFDLARAQAKKADENIKKGEQVGLLNGIPTSIKDIMPVKGVRTTFGSKLYENYIPEENYVAVQRLLDAGCVLLGRTNTPEFGHKAVTDNLIFGATRNPWNLERTSGGSSGGAAAAVASGLSPLAIGTDGGGSIRIPSSLCGCYGLKPTYGRIPRYPSTYMAFDSLSHLGPITWYVEDAALLLDVLKGYYPKDYYALPDQDISYVKEIKEIPEKLKIGYSIKMGFVKAIDPEVEQIVLNSVQKFEKLDWTVEPVDIKIRNPENAFIAVYASELACDYKSKLDKCRDIITPTLVKAIEAGLKYMATDLESALSKRKELFVILSEFFTNYDLLITPTTGVPAFDLGLMYPDRIAGKPASPLTWMSYTYPFNMTGIPAASIPCGWSKDGLPIGMQIIGKKFDELTVLQASKAFQDLAPWQNKHPDIP